MCVMTLFTTKQLALRGVPRVPRVARTWVHMRYEDSKILNAFVARQRLSSRAMAPLAHLDDEVAHKQTASLPHLEF
jgi:hypothetical protein